jgi:hypothetical protein
MLSQKKKKVSYLILHDFIYVKFRTWQAKLLFRDAHIGIKSTEEKK